MTRNGKLLVGGGLSVLLLLVIGGGVGIFLFFDRPVGGPPPQPGVLPSGEPIAMPAWIELMREPGFVYVGGLETEVHSFALFRVKPWQFAFGVRFLTDYEVGSSSYGLRRTTGEGYIKSETTHYQPDRWTMPRGESHGRIIHVRDRDWETAVYRYKDARGSFQAKLSVDAEGNVTPVSMEATTSGE